MQSAFCVQYEPKRIVTEINVFKLRMLKHSYLLCWSDAEESDSENQSGENVLTSCMYPERAEVIWQYLEEGFTD